MIRIVRWVCALMLGACVVPASASTLMDGVTTLAAGWVSRAQSSDELWRELAPHVTLTVPKAVNTPVPLVVMAPGCLGWRPHHERWRTVFLAAGHAVLHVDSFAARGLTDPKAIEAVACEGKGRGGRAKLNTPISGRAAPMGEDRARVFRSTEDEQTTTPE
ncbi:MAG: hypothetical protein LW862_22410, partial [Rubrivivax sp.]|nr:hypothetical protein [Rubrivivax sp.]